MDRAAERYRSAMTSPHSGGVCRYCRHHVKNRHVGAWCADCAEADTRCGAAELLDLRASLLATARRSW